MQRIVDKENAAGLETFQCENAEDERDQEHGQEKRYATAEGGVADL
jgi:hypothetical protein